MKPRGLEAAAATSHLSSLHCSHVGRVVLCNPSQVRVRFLCHKSKLPSAHRCVTIDVTAIAQGAATAGKVRVIFRRVSKHCHVFFRSKFAVRRGGGIRKRRGKGGGVFTRDTSSHLSRLAWRVNVQRREATNEGPKWNVRGKGDMPDKS